jgi:hypothetical protein
MITGCKIRGADQGVGNDDPEDGNENVGKNEAQYSPGPRWPRAAYRRVFGFSDHRHVSLLVDRLSAKPLILPAWPPEAIGKADNLRFQLPDNCLPDS